MQARARLGRSRVDAAGLLHRLEDADVIAQLLGDCQHEL